MTQQLPLEGDALVVYLKGLQPGERVVETGVSCLQGREGTVYLGSQGEVCVLWDKKPGEGGQMGSSVTGGARRVTEVQTEQPVMACSAFVLAHFPKPSHPRKQHECRVCGQLILEKEPCCIWSGLTPGEGWWTCHTHPECFEVTKDWEHDDWELMAPGDEPRPAARMRWPSIATADRQA